MAEFSNDTLWRVVLGGMDRSDRRVLEHILSDLSGVSAFDISDDGVLVVSLGSAGMHESLARALSAAGIVPMSADEYGATGEGGVNAC